MYLEQVVPVDGIHIKKVVRWTPQVSKKSVLEQTWRLEREREINVCLFFMGSHLHMSTFCYGLLYRLVAQYI